MQEEPPEPATHGVRCGGVGGGDAERVVAIENLVKENRVIVIGKRGCCMCHVVKTLLIGLGVNPPVFEIDGDINEAFFINSLSNYIIKGQKKQRNVNNLEFPVVFVGGQLFGGLDKVMATHLSGDLVPILKQAGALWL